MQTAPVEESPGWPLVREAQLVTAQTVAQTGLVVTYDTGKVVPTPGNPPGKADLHPLNKEDVAHRLALEVENRLYGLNTPRSPTYSAMAIEGASVRISFHDAEQGLMVATKTTFDPVVESQSAPANGFAISGADKHWYWASAKIDGATVVVSSPSVQAPVAVRYAWGQNPIGNVYGRGGLPISPFRTDADFMVNVIDGQGTGAYREGAQVTVSSAAGRALTTWAGDTNLLPNPAATSNAFTMPSGYVSLQPVYH
jgi:sialate O-acetylesterase